MQISTTRWSNFSFCETVFILQQLKTSCSLPQQRKLKFCLMLAIWHRHWCELWICKQGSSIETPVRKAVSLNQNNAHKCHIKTFSRSGASFKSRAKVILIIAAAELGTVHVWEYILLLSISSPRPSNWNLISLSLHFHWSEKSEGDF